jgi:8-oxo-dGTP pyrophosphatase MutT (NUDIX family)
MSIDFDRLRGSLLAAPAADFVAEDGAADGPLTPAAVLFPIVLREAAPTVLLTQRTAHLKDHAGQIAFPGGRVEASDNSPVDTALRETEEEIGLARGHVEVLGYLPEYRTGTGFRVTPVVALVRPPFTLTLDAFEVAEAFEVPLAFLLDPANHQRHSLHYRGALRQYFAMPWGDYFIWGATAGMIRSLSERLGLPT